MNEAEESRSDQSDVSFVPVASERQPALKRNVGVFLLGMIFVPVLILLHECGHYFAAKAFGLKAEIHSSETTIHVPEPVPPHIKRVTVAAGPSVDALLTAGGFLWLWYSRRSKYGVDLAVPAVPVRGCDA